MTKIAIALAAIAASVSLTASAATAATCAPRADVARQLTAKFKETRQGLGLTGQATVIELYVAGDGGWTLVATDTMGRSCIIGAGEAWQEEPKVMAGLDS